MRNSSTVIPFPVRADSPERKPEKRKGPPARARASISFALWVRGLPAHLQPEAVTREMLATRSNDLARPIWARRLRQLGDIIRDCPLSGPQRLDLQKKWIEEVRASGIAEKAKRRAARAALISAIDQDIAKN